MAWTQRLAATAMILGLVGACGDAPEPEDGAAMETDGEAAAAGEMEGEPLIPIDRSGIRGTARISSEDEDVVVAVVVQGMDPGQRYAATLHQGRCSGGGAMALPLGDLTAGDDSVASTRTTVTAASLPAGQELFVQVYDGADEPVACADLPTDDVDAAADDSAGDVP